MTEANKIKARSISLDTGGTMTDSFVIDAEGRFAVGKVLTTPNDESEGILNSIEDSLSQWSTSLEAAGSTVDALAERHLRTWIKRHADKVENYKKVWM